MCTKRRVKAPLTFTKKNPQEFRLCPGAVAGPPSRYPPGKRRRPRVTQLWWGLVLRGRESPPWDGSHVAPAACGLRSPGQHSDWPSATGAAPEPSATPPNWAGAGRESRLCGQVPGRPALRDGPRGQRGHHAARGRATTRGPG